MGPNPNGPRAVSKLRKLLSDTQVFSGSIHSVGPTAQRCLGNQPAYNLRLGSYEVQILDQKTPKSLNLHWKINMEPTNQPFRKENDLPNLHDYVPC